MGCILLGTFMRCVQESDLMGMIKMRNFGVDGVAAMMMPWWQHLGMG